MYSHFYSCDWGTSAFRLRLVDVASLTVLASREEGGGIKATFEAWEQSGEPDRFRFFRTRLEEALTALASEAPQAGEPFPIVLSGMASSSIGMKELPYASLPMKLDASGLIVDRIRGEADFPNDIFLVSGVQKPGDVMRGEEVQALGWNLLQGRRGAGLLIFPGTHSKHLVIKKDQVTDFRTFMTGELYHVIAEHTILKNSIRPTPDWTEAHQQTFCEGVRSTKLENLTNLFFSIRAGDLQGRYTKEEAGFFLSGLLIGFELNDVTAKWIGLCGEEKLQPLYELAFRTLNLRGEVMAYPPEMARQFVLAGQRAVLG